MPEMEASDHTMQGNPGVIVGIFMAAQAGAPMESQVEVNVVAGRGIVGDRYATGHGYWSDPKWPDQQLTLVEAEAAEESGIPAEQLRRNLVTRGIALDSLIGVTFQCGEAVLRGVRRCDPCRYLETLTRPGLAQALGTRGGLRAEVL